MSKTLSSKERLKSKKLIDSLFSEGKSVSSFPLKCFYLPIEQQTINHKAGFSVSKKNFKKAVERNRIKRLIREAYRIHRDDIFNKNETYLAFMFLYIGKDTPEYKEVEKAMIKLLIKLKSKLNSRS